jgi:hypothetical protein
LRERDGVRGMPAARLAAPVNATSVKLAVGLTADFPSL